jgi:hypothetical protein
MDLGYTTNDSTTGLLPKYFPSVTVFSGSRERQNNLTIDIGNTWAGRLSASST